MAVRSATAEGIRLLSWTHTFEGHYRTQQGKHRRAYTRTLVAKFRLKNNVGYIGKELRVAVCHLHHHVGNKAKGFRKANDDFWP